MTIIINTHNFELETHVEHHGEGDHECKVHEHGLMTSRRKEKEGNKTCLKQFVYCDPGLSVSINSGSSDIMRYMHMTSAYMPIDLKLHVPYNFSSYEGNSVKQSFVVI